LTGTIFACHRRAVYKGFHSYLRDLLKIGGQRRKLMKKKGGKKELLKLIRTGLRLKTKPPKQEKPATVYNRKSKHKRTIDASSFYLPEFTVPVGCGKTGRRLLP
jgi:hypothetical protein